MTIKHQCAIFSPDASKRVTAGDISSTLMLQKLQKFGWQGGPKTGAAIVLEYVSEPVAGPTQPRRACAI